MEHDEETLGAPMESSVELLRQARGGDPRALERLFTRYVPRLRRWASGRLPRWARDVVETDDMIQDTLLRTVRQLDRFEPRHDGAVQAYLRQALNNRIRDELRRARREPLKRSLPEDRQAPEASPLEEAIGKQAYANYEAALERLREDQRHAVVARLELGFSYAEIAQALGKPSPDAARVMVSRSIVRLAEEMGRA